MSGLYPSWSEDDAATFGEQVARCPLAGCHSPLELDIREQVIFERCSHGRHVQHVQSVFPDDCAAA